MYKTYKFDDENRLLVYPKAVPIREIPLPSHSWLGEMEVRRWIIEDPFSIAGVREYRYGDPLNTLNWKATARSGKLQVHNRSYTSDHRLLIWINFDTDKLSSNRKNQERMELAIRYSASLAEYAVSRGVNTGFGCNGQLVDSTESVVRIAPGGGQAHMTGLYEVFAKLLMETRVTFEEFLEYEIKLGTTNCDIISFTTAVSPRADQLLDRLKRNGNAVQKVILQDRTDNGISGAQASGRAVL
jgi:uncharacterized protein (DUF58 family)